MPNRILQQTVVYLIKTIETRLIKFKNETFFFVSGVLIFFECQKFFFSNFRVSGRILERFSEC